MKQAHRAYEITGKQLYRSHSNVHWGFPNLLYPYYVIIADVVHHDVTSDHEKCRACKNGQQ